MRTITMYQCDICKQIHSNKNKIKECEAHHYGITVEIYEQWLKLDDEVRKASSTIASTKNEVTEKAFDDAIMRQIAFEKEHGFDMDVIVNKEPLTLE